MSVSSHEGSFKHKCSHAHRLPTIITASVEKLGVFYLFSHMTVSRLIRGKHDFVTVYYSLSVSTTHAGCTCQLIVM